MRSVILLLREKRPLKLQLQVQFLDRLSKLLIKNYSIKHALEFMVYDPQLGRIAEQFIVRLRSGESLDSCFKESKFQPSVVTFLYFSKESGKLPDHITNCTRILNMRMHFQKKLKEILTYPLFLLGMSLIIFFAISTNLLPLYSSAFNSFNDKNSFSFFQQLVQTVNFILVYGTILSLLIISIAIIIFYKSHLERKMIILNQIPIARKFASLFFSSQLAYHLSSLLQSGLTIKESLQIMSNQNESSLMRLYANEAWDHLSQGTSLYHSFKDLLLIEPDMKHLILRSEAQGTLNEDLNTYSVLILDAIEDRIRRLIVMVQPILYSVLGIFIIFIYVLTLYPMFQMMNKL
ncbi:hypothetical protein CEY16_04300 [Halalkalibacillus sediminis]|uniref:Type II secretion system protein GspF domain-containing protein n=1 Tax=Halalkalibacillus sediminis TaxID=2018042 RepID=A0A2I0QXB6_9BACI|nr:type II secretion system F family protein [Halalkalibacillus sediminis]PKR78981.1 hypothetical protein CEY16_04300 [Halalkalibacillus sediminis]